MVHTRSSPAIDAFLAKMPETFEFVQVLITRRTPDFELRHVQDRTATDPNLELYQVEDLREIANHTEAGEFRPLKPTPNLRAGWRVLAGNAEQLERGLSMLYPGALADWYVTQAGNPPITSYRDFVNRQTGMYRIAQMLSDEQVTDVVMAGCHQHFCLKQRLWTGGQAKADGSTDKSVIPCLEPCAILLEFARKSMRLEQEEKVKVELAPGDVTTMLEAVNNSLTGALEDGREADFGSARNPRRMMRLKILLERLLAQSAVKEEAR